MTTTLQQMIAEPEPLLDRARTGEEIVLTDGGKPVVRLTGIAMGPRKAPPGAIAALLSEARAAAAAGATGKIGATADETVAKLRSERRPLTEAQMESRRKWLDEVARHAAAASTGKKPQMTEQEFWDDMRGDR